MRETSPCYLVEKFFINKRNCLTAVFSLHLHLCVCVCACVCVHACSVHVCSHSYETENFFFFVFFTYLLLKFEVGHFSSQSTDTNQRKFSSLEAAWEPFLFQPMPPSPNPPSHISQSSWCPVPVQFFLPQLISIICFPFIFLSIQ